MTTPKKKVVFTFDEEVSPGQFQQRSLVGRIGKQGGRDYEGPEWVSRDHVLLIPCQRTSCPVNSSRHCSMPPKIAINSAGECITGIDFKQNPAVLPTKNICRWCGAAIAQQGSFWIHTSGEKMSHPATPR